MTFISPFREIFCVSVYVAHRWRTAYDQLRGNQHLHQSLCPVLVAAWPEASF